MRQKMTGAYIAVWSQGKILLIKNSYKKKYTIPSGGVNKNESIIQAAARELKEETGIEVHENSLLFYKEYISHEEYKEDHINLFELFLESAPKVKIDNREVIWGEFKTKDEALKYNLFKPVRDYLLSKSH
ncbi:MAG: NUDIX hydrolase [Bdellovibrionales bacterium]|nr:NUDIX hydrolase [Bdellovibrionales bacterium]